MQGQFVDEDKATKDRKKGRLRALLGDERAVGADKAEVVELVLREGRRVADDGDALLVRSDEGANILELEAGDRLELIENEHDGLGAVGALDVVPAGVGDAGGVRELGRKRVNVAPEVAERQVSDLGRLVLGVLGRAELLVVVGLRAEERSAIKPAERQAENKKRTWVMKMGWMTSRLSMFSQVMLRPHPPPPTHDLKRAA